jgi:type I restriction enzyme S subunit
MTKLPEGWVIKRLDEIAEIVMGQSPPGSSYNEHGEGQPFFQGKTEFGEVHPTVRKYTTAGTKFAKAGDILMSVRAPVGPTNIADIDCVIGRGLAAIRAKTVVSQDYLRWSLKHLEIDIQSKGTGTTFDAITGETLRGTLVALPPIDDQHKTVELLEDHLSRLDTAIADVQKVSRDAGRLERSVLFKLFDEGKKEIGKTWSIAKMKDILQQDKSGSKLGQGWSPQCESEAALAESDWGSLKTTSVQYGEFDWRHNKLLPSHLEPRPLLEIEVGDFLITRLGPRNRCGVICQVKSTKKRIMLPDKMFRFRPNLDLMDPQFFEYFLISPQSIELLNSLKTGGSESGMNITQERFLKIEIYFPDLMEQRRLVKLVDNAISLAKHAKASLEIFDSSSESFRRSLFQAAFTGQLTKEVVSV